MIQLACLVRINVQAEQGDVPVIVVFKFAQIMMEMGVQNGLLVLKHAQDSLFAVMESALKIKGHQAGFAQ